MRQPQVVGEIAISTVILVLLQPETHDNLNVRNNRLSIGSEMRCRSSKAVTSVSGKGEFSAILGGETIPILTPFSNVSLFDISPDKSELLVGSFTGTEEEQPVWAMPVLGGSPRRIGLLGAKYSLSSDRLSPTEPPRGP